MAKKIVTLFVLAVFCYFEMTCYPLTIRKTVIQDQSEVNRSDATQEIISVVTKEGRLVEFRKGRPGKVAPGEDSVIGIALQPIDIDRKDIKKILRGSKGDIDTIETLDGRFYEVVSFTEETDRILFSVYAPITIPFSDIQQVWVRKTNVGAIVANVVIVAGVACALSALAAYSFEKSLEDVESCPFVYSWNGEDYVLDAEPYGAAVSEGLKRTDWVELSNLREVDGKYRVLLTNELHETQCTDELKLVAVDHAPGVRIAPDLMGRAHTFDCPLPPASAVDQKGRDILAFVGKNDQVFWLSDLDEKSPDGDGDLRDEIVLEFPKPAGAAKAKLLANIWTTPWGSLSAGKFMGLYGSALGETYEEVDRHGPMYGRVLSWMAAEELYTLKVWVETPEGWKARGMIMGGAPVITKDKAYVLDVADVPGEVLRIKLRPPVNFWMVDSLAVDYAGDQPVQVTELAAETAVDHTGRDARAVLAATDGSYLESSNPGERTELVFTAPPLKEGFERTVLVKASGYYKVHLDTTGEPRTELVERVLGEPGFAARYSFREYLKWEAGLRAGQAKAGR